jgi:hypothetical protein
MDFWKQAADSVTRAVNFVVDQNRRAAMVNRLKTVIKTEKEHQARAYIELGKYYYETMRDPDNARTEPQCAAVDSAARRLKKAYAKLDELVVPAGQPCSEEGCGSAEAQEQKDAAQPGNAEAEKPAEPEAPPKPETPPEPPVPPQDEEAADDDEDFLHSFSAEPNGETGSKDENGGGQEGTSADERQPQAGDPAEPSAE